MDVGIYHRADRMCPVENIWGNVKIKLLDTIFWTKLSATPDGYNEKYRKKTNLIDYDFVIMPMFRE